MTRLTNHVPLGLFPWITPPNQHPNKDNRSYRGSFGPIINPKNLSFFEQPHKKKLITQEKQKNLENQEKSPQKP